MELDAPGSIRLRLFGFPIAINWTVVILGVLAFVGGSLPVLAVALFFPVVVVSILIHELGHAFMARASRARVDGILLYLMGGLTFWTHGSALVTRTRRVWISAAGSLGQAAVGVGVFVAMRAGSFGDESANLMSHPFDDEFWQAAYREDYLPYALGLFVWVSVFWAIFNWLPIGGLDGGHMTRELLTRRNPASGHELARRISIGTLILAGLWLFASGNSTFAILLVLIALPSILDRTR